MMTGKIWDGLICDGDDEDEDRFIPAIVCMWVERVGPVACDVVKRYKFKSRATREESERLAVQYDKQAHEKGIVSMLNRRWRDLVLEWLATLALGDPEWDRKSPFYGGLRTNWGKTLVESKL